MIQLMESRREIAARTASRLIEARRHAHLSQTDVAERIGIQPNTLSGWESGKRMPRAPELWQLAEVYGCTTDYLVGRCDLATGLPESRLLVDSDRVQDALSARSPAELSAMVDWHPQMIPFWQIIKPTARLRTHREVQQLALRLTNHAQSVAPEMCRRYEQAMEPLQEERLLWARKHRSMS